MTHQNHQTNGASLEDCHTNFFALTDLCGIKWRKFLLGERPNASGDPLDDPVLRSYSRCLERDILCVWRRVAAPKPEPDPKDTIAYEVATSHTHPPLSLTAAKELWIFWYGEEPNLTGLVDPELLKTSDANAQGAWESGLSYECRSLLFKALHNLIERCLLSKDIVRLGKWFVQPCSSNDKVFGKSSHHLSFSFAFFVHGESTVCASMDLREHPAVRPLSPDYLAEAAAAQSNSDARPKPVILAPYGIAATLTGNSFKSVDVATAKFLEDWCSFYPLCNKDNSQLPPIVEVVTGGVKMRYPSKYVLVTELDYEETRKFDDTTNQTQNQQQLQNSEQQTQTQKLTNNKPLLLLDNSINNYGNVNNVHIPPSAATILPERVWQDCITNSTGVLANSNTNLHSPNNHNSSNTINNTNNSNNASSNNYNNNNSEDSLNTNCSNTTNNTNNNININNNQNEKSSNNNSSSAVSNMNNNNNNNNEGDNSNQGASDSTSSTNSSNNSVGSSSSAVQNSCSNLNSNINASSNNDNNNNVNSSNSSNSNSSSSSNNNNNNNNHNNSINNDLLLNKAGWDFTDPVQKTACSCSSKCRKTCGSNRVSSNIGITSSSTSSMGGCSVGSSHNAGGKPTGTNRYDKFTRFYRVPFHRRQNYTENNYVLNNIQPHRQQHQQHHHQENNFIENNNIIGGFSKNDDSSTTITTTTLSSVVSTMTGIFSSTSMQTSSTSSGSATATTCNSRQYGDNITAVNHSAAFIASDTLATKRSSDIWAQQVGNTSSYSRNPHSIGESMPVPSVGSPGSAGPSPHPNSQLSQPTSVPSADQLLSALSPRPPTSVPSMQPQTPIDHLDKNTPAPTPTDQQDNKSITASPYIQPTPSVEPPPSTEPPLGTNGGCSMTKMETNFSGNNEQSKNIQNFGPVGNLHSATSRNNYSSLLKRPSLSTKDYENSIDDDLLMQNPLYDFSSVEAWMNHPVKRFKPNEDVKSTQRKLRGRNIYEGHDHSKFTMPSLNPAMFALLNENQIKNEFLVNENDMSSNVDNGLMYMHEIKKEPTDETSKDKSLTGDLYTNEGLQVSYKDLEQIFDNSDDNSNDDTLQVHTPPGSNKSTGGGLDDIIRSISTNPSTGGILRPRPEELSKMFPTPPSHEHHPISSPCSGGYLDMLMTDVTEGSKIKHEIYPELGSPADEPMEDWSYVFMPPPICKFVGSSKYAPLTGLPSESLPPIVLPPNCIYKPSWQQPQRQQQQQQQELQQQQQHSHMQQSQQQSHNQQQLPTNGPSNPMNSTNQSGNISNSMNLNAMDREKMQSQQPVLVNQLSRPPSNASMMNFGNSQAIMQQQLALRSGMSPISPAPGPSVGGFPGGSPMNHMNPYRRTPIPPPPPYELAVSSPATSTSSYLNKQYNSQEPPTPSSAATRTPEANSLLINILLYDTSLNIFRDHNFDSCTLCVCNADGQKCVGNIRGSDSGVYVALPGSSFNPAASVGNGNFNTTGNTLSGNNSIRNVSAFGGIDSPMCTGGNASSNQHQNGYIDEDPITCRCGFSAVVNRRLAYRSGLFYEDEMEITGMAQDPSIYKKKPLLSILLPLPRSNDENTLENRNNSNDNGLPQIILDLLRDHCTIVQSSSCSIQRAAYSNRRKIHTLGLNSILNVLEFTDANDVICLAIEQGRTAYETALSVSGVNRMEIEAYRPQKATISVHKWPYVLASGTRNNQDIVRIMKSMQPLLQHAFHTKCITRLWEPTYTVKGPLTWRQFHMLAGRGTGQCEPQPIPSVIVGHEKDWLSVAPYAIHYWDKLLLEPYSYPRDVAYLVVAPDNDFVVSKTKFYFKELSTTYEMCKLGRHTPVKGWDGILRVGAQKGRNNDNSLLDEWFQSLGDSKLAEKIRMYANAFQNLLAPYLARIPSDRSLLDPPETCHTSSNNSALNKDRPLPSPMLPPSTPDPLQPTDKAPSTPKGDNDSDQQRENLNASSSTSPCGPDPLSSGDDDLNPPVIVIYVVEPFTFGSDSPDLQRLACLSLLRCYSSILAAIPESIRCNVNLQIISLESILELGRTRNRLRFSDEMRCTALSVFSQCRRYLAHTSNVKSLTGFGTAANMELFLKNKDEKNRAPYKMYTPPYILAPQHEKCDKTDIFRLKTPEQQYSVMYCNYCLSEDQTWLLAAATDDRGELLETVTINIDIPNRSRRKRASARRFGLQKLMDFILGVISQTVTPWRLVVGRIGRIGHGELKSWSSLLSKQNLQKASKQLKDICKQCSLMYPHSVPSILSACLVTLEPDSNLRVMPDQFTPDERFSQISMQNPLSTPQDVTCTHILVFPTSAVSQSFQKAFNETHINGLEGDDMIFDFEDQEDTICDVNTLGEIFDWDQVPMQQTSPERNSNHGSPGCLEDNRSRQSPGPGGGNFGSVRNMHDPQDIEEVGQVLQQPLALGYLVSTAPTGRMPSWFWSSCPHLENVCPVFLKTALHLHVPGIQQTTDDPLVQSHSSANDHPLDSQLTADVLRYVLEGYNVLSWLAMDSNTHDRLSCLPIHVQVLMQLYHMTAAMT